MSKRKNKNVIIQDWTNYNAWYNFAVETAKNDFEDVKNYFLKDEVFRNFATIMSYIIQHEKVVESVLWTSVVPQGTEDRTWFRSFADIVGVKEYKDITTSFDGAHAIRCQKTLNKYIKKYVKEVGELQ